MVGLLLGSVLTVANADLYKVVDEDGQVIYTNTPKKGAVRLQVTPPPASSSNKPKSIKQKLPRPKARATHIDDGRKAQIPPEAEDIRTKILQDELLREKALLAKAKEALGRVSKDRPNERFYLEAEVADHEKNIREIQKALTKLRGS